MCPQDHEGDVLRYAVYLNAGFGIDLDKIQTEGWTAPLRGIHFSWPVLGYRQEIAESLYFTSLMYMPFARARSFYKEPQVASLVLQGIDLWKLAEQISARISIILNQIIGLVGFHRF